MVRVLSCHTQGHSASLSKPWWTQLFAPHVVPEEQEVKDGKCVISSYLKVLVIPFLQVLNETLGVYAVAHQLFKASPGVKCP